jgi:biopolymer transport protein ExbD
MRALIVVAALLAACGKGKAECSAEAKDIAAFLTAANTDPPFYAGDAKLVVREELTAHIPAEEHPITLQVLPDGYAFYSKVPADQLASQLLDLHQFNGSPRIYLAIDSAAPWSAVVAAVDQAKQAGFTKPAFLFRTQAKVTPPPPSKVDAELDAIMKTPSEHVGTDLAALMAKTVESCTSLKKAFQSVSANEPEDRAAVLIRAIQEALPECKCDLDTASLRSIMWRILANPTPDRMIAFDGRPTEKSIALPGATPWSEASKQLTPDTASATFTVQP